MSSGLSICIDSSSRHNSRGSGSGSSKWRTSSRSGVEENKNSIR